MNQADTDLINKKVIYTSLLLQEFGYRELLDSPLVKGQSRYLCTSKLKYVQNQLRQIKKASKAPKEQIVHSEDLAMDNVGLMASIVGTLAIVPATQIDFLESEFFKLCMQAVNNHNNEKTREKNKIPA